MKFKKMNQEIREILCHLRELNNNYSVVLFLDMLYQIFTKLINR